MFIFPHNNVLIVALLDGEADRACEFAIGVILSDEGIQQCRLSCGELVVSTAAVAKMGGFRSINSLPPNPDKVDRFVHAHIAGDRETMTVVLKEVRAEGDRAKAVAFVAEVWLTQANIFIGAMKMLSVRRPQLVDDELRDKLAAYKDVKVFDVRQTN